MDVLIHSENLIHILNKESIIEIVKELDLMFLTQDGDSSFITVIILKLKFMENSVILDDVRIIIFNNYLNYL
jgi:hypothetical protein